MIILLLLVRIVVFALGAYLVFRACLSALRTFVLPRSAPDRFNRTTFIVVRQFFEWRSKRLQTYLERDRVMELYAPATILRWRKGHKLIETHEWIPPSNT